jgi:hypothetical protein
MRKIMSVVMALTAFPAYADVSSFRGPDGATIHKVTCQSDEAECYQQAAAVCGKSYQIMGSESHAGGLLADWGPGPVTWYSMNVRCGASDGRTARFEHRGGVYVPPRPFYLQCGSDYYGVECGGWR